MRSWVDLEMGKSSSFPSSAVPSAKKPGTKSDSSSCVNQSCQSTRFSSPRAVASLMWQVKRSGISCRSPPFWASFKKPPILEALERFVTCTRTPCSCPTVWLNSCTKTSMGEPDCSP